MKYYKYIFLKNWITQIHLDEIVRYASQRLIRDFKFKFNYDNTTNIKSFKEVIWFPLQSCPTSLFINFVKS